MRYIVFFTILLFTLGPIFSRPVLALTVSPPRLEITVDPGQTYEGEFALFNEQDTTKTFYSSFEKFEARGETGAPHFVPDKSGLASWIKTKSEITLEAEERQVVPFTIEVPENAEPGGHFAAIFWGSTPPKVGDGQVAIGGKIGILVLLRVTGDTVEGGGILDFKADGGRLVSALPISFQYRFSNDGGDRVRPAGEVTVKNIVGMTAGVVDANKAEGNVLPSSIRKYSALWHSKGQQADDLSKREELDLASQYEQAKKAKPGFFETAKAQWRNFAFGIYKAKLDITYGVEKTNAQDSYWFLVIPWQLLSIIIFILVVLGFGGRKGLKKYNQWIIKQARTGGA